MAKRRKPLALPDALLDIVEKRNMGSQQDLLAALRKADHDVSQPTLSRQLKRLHIVKRRGRYTRVDESLSQPPSFSLRPAPPNLIVLKTLPARAQLLAVLLDQARLPEIAGTTAGDDTVFVAVAEGHDLESASAAITQALEHNDPT
ncbi:MAG: arginine repressor [Gammaproteobacteria bacterium]